MNAGDPRRLLAVCYGGGHVAAVVPVVQALESRGWQCTTLALTTARQYAESRGLACIGFADLLRASDHDARRFGEELATGMESGRIPFDESVAYLGLSFADLVNAVGEQQARRRYAEQGRAAFEPITAVQRAVDLVGPSVILTTNSPRAERTALQVAHDRDIDSVSILDLFGSGDESWVPDFADTTFCVLGDAVAERLVRGGAKPDALVVTGNPAFDGLFDPVAVESGQTTRTQLSARLSLGDERPAVLVALPPRAPDDFMTWVNENLRDSAAMLCFRQHPSSGTSTTIVCGSASYEAPDHLGISLEAWLHASDLVISTGSTVSLQAVLVDTPTILAQGWGPMGFGPDDLNRWAPCRTVLRHEALNHVVDELLAPTSVPQMSATNARMSAAELVADVIERR